MNNTQSQSESLESAAVNSQLSVSKKIHPEDIRVGDDVAISEVLYQYPSYPWQGGVTTLQAQESVDVTFLSPPDATPMIVRAVCLPFVLCQTEPKQHRVYDVRQVQLVRLSKAFGKAFRDARKSDMTSESVSEKKKRKKKKSGKGKKKKRKIK